MAGDKKNAVWALLLSLLAFIATSLHDYYNDQFVVTPNEMVGLLLP